MSRETRERMAESYPNPHRRRRARRARRMRRLRGFLLAAGLLVMLAVYMSGRVPLQPAEGFAVGDGNSFSQPQQIRSPSLPSQAPPAPEDELDGLVSNILDEIIEDGMSPLEQARAVFDYVHDNILYTGSSDKSDWRTGACAGLTTGKGDCFTYYAVSRALLTALDIDNLPVERTGGETHHFWNLVNCGDGWYHFDACPRSSKLPPFVSFMVTDRQAADFTAAAGRNYYDFDGSLLPERAVKIITEN